MEMYTFDQIKKLAEAGDVTVRYEKEYRKLGEAPTDRQIERFCRLFRDELNEAYVEKDPDLLAWKEFKSCLEGLKLIRQDLAEYGEADADDLATLWVSTTEKASAPDRREEARKLRSRMEELFEAADRWERFVNHGKGLSPLHQWSR